MSKLRVLVVDDQARARRSLKALLAVRHLSGEVREAADGGEALGLMEDFEPDVVLMDVRMPRMDGVEATRHIKARWSGVKVLVLSMYGEHEAEALAAGADGFYCKVEPPEKLLAALARVAQDEKGEK